MRGITRSHYVNRVRWFIGYRGVYQFIWWKRGDQPLEFCVRTAAARWINDLRFVALLICVLWLGWIWGMVVGFVLMVLLSALRETVQVTNRVSR